MLRSLCGRYVIEGGFMSLRDPSEIFLALLLYRWEKNSPEQGKQGLLDGIAERNTQVARMVYLLQKISVGIESKVLNKLSVASPRNDGESYISKSNDWMKEPREILNGWYFEGCTSLIQKQQILSALSKCGYSNMFIACAENFVGGESIKQYFPTEEEANKILSKVNQSDITIT